MPSITSEINETPEWLKNLLNQDGVPERLEEEEEDQNSKEEEHSSSDSDEEKKEEGSEANSESGSDEDTSEEEAGDSWEDESVSEVSIDALERRYVLDTESFTHLKDPGLVDALILVDPKAKPEKKLKGMKRERDEYMKLCEELGVVPCSKFLRNIRNEVMDLSFMGLNQKGIIAVCKSLCHNNSVKTLLLRGNDCGGEAAEALSELLETNQLMQHLDIARTNILKAMKRICEALRKNVTLQVLDISSNDLTDNEMKFVSRILSIEEGVLRELYLRRNYIMDQGLFHLSEGLWKNRTLEIIDLAFNRFWGEKESLPFYQAAAQLWTLRKLDLEGNSIKDSATKAIANIMASRKSNLEYLNISYNLITHVSCDVLGKSFARSRTTPEFIAGPNRWNVGPLTQGYMVNMITPMTGGTSNEVATLLDLSIITPIHQEFIKRKEMLKRLKPKLKLIHGEPFGFNDGNRPYMQRLIIRRANVICENFETPLSMLIDELRTEPATLTPKLFKKFIKSCNLYKDKKMTKEFMMNFEVKGGQDVDCKAIIDAFDKEYPNQKRVLVHEEEEGEGYEMGGVMVSPQNMAQMLKW